MDRPSGYIPILDFKAYNINVDKDSVSAEALKALGTEAVREFEKVGFCYIVNHGIPEESVRNYMHVCRKFFGLAVSAKKQYERVNKASYHGWIGMEEESLNNKIPGDLKETFNFYPAEAPETWPPNIPEFKQINQAMFNQCSELGSRLCEALAVGLGLDRDHFIDSHKLMGKEHNGTALRSLFYPPLQNTKQPELGQVRLGEHSDYGTITILFQDDVGGLEVKIPNKGFVPATPMPGAALVNIGDMMQRWTSDRLIATRHRIGIPETEDKRGKSRQSIAFFINPDDDVIIRCLDGFNKYDPIRAVDYLNERIRQANMT